MMSEQEMTVWGSYGIAAELLREKLQGVNFCFFIHRGNKPVEMWKVVMSSSFHHYEIYSLDEMIGKEREFCDKVALKFLFS
jgi:hypothetical protein